mgnify:CR=1 FL=1
MPEALPTELEQRLRAALLYCGPFDSDSNLRAQQRESERQVKHLFQTLLHRAFTGEM